MSGQRWSMSDDGRDVIRRVVEALRVLDDATRTDQGLVNRAKLGSRDTLYRVLDGKKVLRKTYLGLDEGLLLPPGTLEAAGNRATDRLDELDIDRRLRQSIDLELARSVEVAVPRDPKAV